MSRQNNNHSPSDQKLQGQLPLEKLHDIKQIIITYQKWFLEEKNTLTFLTLEKIWGPTPPTPELMFLFDRMWQNLHAYGLIIDFFMNELNNQPRLASPEAAVEKNPKKRQRPPEPSTEEKFRLFPSETENALKKDKFSDEQIARLKTLPHFITVAEIISDQKFISILGHQNIINIALRPRVKHKKAFLQLKQNLDKFCQLGLNSDQITSVMLQSHRFAALTTLEKHYQTFLQLKISPEEIVKVLEIQSNSKRESHIDALLKKKHICEKMSALLQNSSPLHQPTLRQPAKPLQPTSPILLPS